MKKSKKKKIPEGISRRKFLKGFGITSIGIAAGGEGLLGTLQASCTPGQGTLAGTEAQEIVLNVNGKNMRVMAEPRTTLADALRDQLKLTGTKIGCERGACGACTVIIDGKTKASCMTLAIDVVGAEIETIEGLEADGKLHPIQEAFIEHDAMQCGFCTSGMVMSCKNLLDQNPKPTLDDVKLATSGNLCRCATYNNVFEAVIKTTQKG